MRHAVIVLAAVSCLSVFGSAQSADELNFPASMQN